MVAVVVCHNNTLEFFLLMLHRNGFFYAIGSNDTGNDATTEPIEISVISIDTVQEMLIVQPVEMNPIDTDSSPNRNEQSINIEINNPTIELSNEADLTPSRKKRKR